MIRWLQSLREARSIPERDERLLRDLNEARKALVWVDATDQYRRLERSFDDVQEQLIALADVVTEPARVQATPKEGPVICDA